MTSSERIHVAIILPYARPEGFVDPPPPSPWTDESEAILSGVLARSGGVANVDWASLSETLETPVPVLLFRAKRLLSIQLESLGVSQSNEGGLPRGSRPRSIEGKESSTEAMNTEPDRVSQDSTRSKPSRGISSEISNAGTASAGPSRSGEQDRRERDLVRPAAGRPPVPSSLLRTPTPLQAQPLPPVPTISRPVPAVTSSHSSSSISSSTSSSRSSSPGLSSAARNANQLNSLSTQLEALANFGGGAFALPPSPQLSADPSRTSSSPPSNVLTETRRRMPTTSPESERGQRDTGGEQSGTSSFSDLSNASLSQSALEEAAASQLNKTGNSRLSMFSKLGGTLR